MLSAVQCSLVQCIALQRNTKQCISVQFREVHCTTLESTSFTTIRTPIYTKALLAALVLCLKILPKKKVFIN